jgi:formylglycine-generating enzyme required for sulfatase activity
VKTLLPPPAEDTPEQTEAPRLGGVALLAELTDSETSFHEASLGGAEGAPAMARLDRVLRSCAPSWSFHRLSPQLAGDARATRLTLKRRLDQLSTLSPRVGLVLLAATIVEIDGAPALVTETQWRDHSEDCTLPLSWLLEALATADVELLVLAFSLRGPGVLVRATRQALQAGLAERDDVLAQSQLLVVHHAADKRSLIEQLQLGFAGAAANALGEVTLAQLAARCEERLGAWTSLREGAAGGFLCQRPSMLAAAIHGEPVGPETAELPGTPQHPDLRPGDLLPGRIAILGPLGEGGHGSVYLAEQRRIGRKVAVKLLRRGRQIAPVQVQLFAREIQAIGLLSHPNVVQIFHADVTDGGELFYAMELIDGTPLNRQLAMGQLEAARTRQILDDVLAGLEAAHRVGVYHLDVKPSNVMLRAAPSADEPSRAVLLDFGIARLAESHSHGEFVLGTPGYMAPEQLDGRRCDARTDVYAAGLLLYEMLAGLRHEGAGAPDGEQLRASIEDPALREMIATALASDPDQRYASATAFRDALAGETPLPAETSSTSSPFFYLAAHDERDRWRLFGRESEIERLVGRALAERLVLVSGPSGVGKTSLLRAGVIPALRACGCSPVYVPCRQWPFDHARAMLDPDAPSLAEALTAYATDGAQRVVLIFDHLEALASQERQGSSALAAFCAELSQLLAGPLEQLDVAVVLSVREEYVARLAPLRRAQWGALAELSVGSLPRAAAERALRQPLDERGVDLEPALVETLLDELATAARGLAGLRGGPSLGQQGDPVYPPHLQMVATVLYEGLGERRRLTLSQYRALGGLDGVLREHLDQTLDRSLSAPQASIARGVFKELVSSEGTRATRSEDDLLSALAGTAEADEVRETLVRLQHERLLVTVRLAEDRVGWELVHDSLVPRIRAWMDRRELDQRRARELLRLHLNRSKPAAPFLLTRRDVREISRHPEVVAQLDRGLRAAEGSEEPPLSASALLARSRRYYRLRYGSLAAAVALLLGISLVLGLRQVRQREARLRDWARSELTLKLFVVRGGKVHWVPSAELPKLRVTLRRVGPAYGLVPGDPVSRERFRATRQMAKDGAPRFALAASGGDYTLVVHGRHRRGSKPCAPALLWRVRLPGYVDAARGDKPPELALVVPSCAETRRELEPIPGGAYFSGDDDSHKWYARRRYVLDDYSIDRTEVSNGAYRRYVEGTRKLTGARLPDFSQEYSKRWRRPDSPASGLGWRQARAYCLWIGKSLPTFAQHEKAGRGGIWLDGDASKQRENPMPRRRFPWGNDPRKDPDDPRVAQWPRAVVTKNPERNGPDPVDSHPLKNAAYPALRNLVGNVGEWLADGPRKPKGFRDPDGTRNPSGPTDDSTRYRLAHYAYWRFRWKEGLWISWAEPVPAANHTPALGFRCATPLR